jgi:hypothetical protein
MIFKGTRDCTLFSVRLRLLNVREVVVDMRERGVGLLLRHRRVLGKEIDFLGGGGLGVGGGVWGGGKRNGRRRVIKKDFRGKEDGDFVD